MNRIGWLVLIALVAMLFAPPTLAHESRAVLAASPETLGHVHFRISRSAAAQEQFDRALAMLHSFWFPQATRVFIAITQTEPDCAMAHWGVAMSQRGNPLLGAPAQGAMETGRVAIEKARTTFSC